MVEEEGCWSWRAGRGSHTLYTGVAHSQVFQGPGESHATGRMITGTGTGRLICTIHTNNHMHNALQITERKKTEKKDTPCSKKFYNSLSGLEKYSLLFSKQPQ